MGEAGVDRSAESGKHLKHTVARIKARESLKHTEQNNRTASPRSEFEVWIVLPMDQVLAMAS